MSGSSLLLLSALQIEIQRCNVESHVQRLACMLPEPPQPRDEHLLPLFSIGVAAEQPMEALISGRLSG
jgi:hypothetical protein